MAVDILLTEIVIVGWNLLTGQEANCLFWQCLLIFELGQVQPAFGRTVPVPGRVLWGFIRIIYYFGSGYLTFCWKKVKFS